MTAWTPSPSPADRLLRGLDLPLSRRSVLRGAAAAGAAAAARRQPSAAQDLSNTVVFAVEGSPPTFDPAGAGTDSRVDTPSLHLYNALV